MERIAKVIKFPTKRQRTSYKKKLFSVETIIEIIRITLGVLLANYIWYTLHG